MKVIAYCLGILTLFVFGPLAAKAFTVFEDSNYRLEAADDTNYTLVLYKGSETSLAIPDIYNSYHITAIGAKAFATNTTLTNVVISGSITNIGDSAFSNRTAIASVTFGTNVAGIDADAFRGCFSLKNIVLPDTLRTIGNRAFDQTGATNLHLGAGVTEIGEYAFRYSQIKNVVIPDSMTHIRYGLFQSCLSLTNVVLPDSIVDISSSAFEKTAIRSIVIPDSVTNIHGIAFSTCSFLTNVVLSSQITDIGLSSFSFCTNLERIVIPALVTNIGNSAFSYASSLKRIYFAGNAPHEEGNVFWNTHTNATVYYMPDTTGWSNTYAGLPAVLWNPHFTKLEIYTNIPGYLRATIAGTTNIPIAIESSTNLLHREWSGSMIGSIPPAGTQTFLINTTVGADRAYRIAPP